MGLIASKLFPSWNVMSIPIIIVGLSGAGKTTALYKMQSGQESRVVPSCMVPSEKICYKNVHFNVWDVGFPQRYCAVVRGVFFVVDSSDRASLELACRELHRLLAHEELRDAPVLVLANKQDLPGALTPSQLVEELRLPSTAQNEGVTQPWFVQGCCAMNGTGLSEGLEWMRTQVGGCQKA